MKVRGFYLSVEQANAYRGHQRIYFYWIVICFCFCDIIDLWDLREIMQPWIICTAENYLYRNWGTAAEKRQGEPVLLY